MTLDEQRDIPGQRQGEGNAQQCWGNGSRYSHRCSELRLIARLCCTSIIGTLGDCRLRRRRGCSRHGRRSFLPGVVDYSGLTRVRQASHEGNRSAIWTVIEHRVLKASGGNKWSALKLCSLNLLKPERQFVATTGSEHHMLLDDPAGGTGPKPIELVAVALAGCTAFDVITVLRQKYHQNRDRL